MKALILLIMVIGLVVIAYGYANSFNKCPPRQVEYRFIPRSMLTEQYQEPKLGEIFHDMFNKSVNKV